MGLPRGPVFTLQLTLRDFPRGMTTSFLQVFTRHNSSWFTPFTNSTRAVASQTLTPTKAVAISLPCRLLTLIKCSIALKPINGSSISSLATRNGTESPCSESPIWRSSSTHPLYGMLLPLAAVTVRSPSSNSLISLTNTLGKFLFIKLAETIETWAPVSHRISALFPLSFALIEHLLPTRLTTFWCCFGVRWLTKIPEFTSSVVCFLFWICCLIALHNVLCCGQ